MNRNKIIAGAAMASLLGALAVPAYSHANTQEKGHCMGANACGGKSGCGVKGSHSCKGHNGCKGKGFLELTKEECEQLSKKDKKDYKFEVVKK